MLRIVGFGKREGRKVFQMEETAVTKEERKENTELFLGGGQAKNRLI